MTADLLQAIKERRSYYSISKDIQITEERIKEIVEQVVKYTPSSFNSQTARLVVLTGASHDKLWDLTSETLKVVMGERDFTATGEKMAAFKAGYGTVLFFEDESVVRSFQDKFASYADKFPVWSQQSSGMVQYALWTSLEAAGLGASLQHYNPLIDEKVKQEWNLPESWKLIAQMPFGQPTAQPGEKEVQPIENRVKFFK